MSLRNSKLFRAIAIGLVTLALGSFVLNVGFVVLSGQGAETYKNVKGFNIHYSSALVLILALVAVGLVALGIRLLQHFRKSSRRGGV